MKRFFALVLCLMLLCSFLAMPVSALSYYVSHYEEIIYAGGVVDLYAYPSTGDPEDFTYQWQYDAGFGDNSSWYDIQDNSSYSGSKTNHLQIHTSTGSYDGWEAIPFQCVVTSSDGTVRKTNNIYIEIYPTDKLIPNMKDWGYGLYTPSITNVIDFYTKDEIHYTASTYAGSNLHIFCGHKSLDDKPILGRSEVALTTEIHITENGHTTISGNNTSYIPYTVGKIQVAIKEMLSIGEYDLGCFDEETIDITVAKPNAIAKGTAQSDCSLLRYTYNESQKLASIPKGTVVEVIGQVGSYYQVFYNNYVGYVATSALKTDTIVNKSLIKNVDILIDQPVAGQTPATTCTIQSPGCELYKTDPITWLDNETGKLLQPNEVFQEGKSYTLGIWLAAQDGYRFQLDASGNPKITGCINGNLPFQFHKAYEQDPEKVIELTYTFHNTPKAPEEPEPTDPPHTHTLSDWIGVYAYHYKVCTVCGDMLDDDDHRGGEPTCNKMGLCTDCGYPYLPATGIHTPDTSKWIPMADRYHYHPCAVCGVHLDVQDHRWSPTYLYQDETGHALICADCGTTSFIESHIPGPEATATSPQVCTACGYVIAPAQIPKTNPFVDVAENTYCYDAVLWAYYNDITTGTDETHFTPNGPCTRAQVVTFLWRAAGSPEPVSPEHPFTDLKESAFYYKAVLWAVQSGITNGTSATTFSPGDSCTRSQVVTFLWRSNGSPEPMSQAHPFTDLKESAFYYKAVLWAVDSGITNGTSATTFSPAATCTRGQIVTFLWRSVGSPK